jgi:uroporphyrinogen-III decarboxylase
VLPFHRRLIEGLSEPGANSIHLCGDATRFFPLLRDELNIRSFDTGFPVDFSWMRQALGPKVEVKGGPSVMFLQSATPAQVREEVRRILDSGIRGGGRFILREGNNLPPDVGLDPLWAMYETVREFGRY